MVDSIAVATQKRNKVMAAIAEHDSAVTVADVVSVTGLPALEVTQLLNRIARDTAGHLQVTSDGDILYRFALDGANTCTRLLKLSRMCGGYFLTAFRFLFGVLLVISLIITNGITAVGLTIMGAMGGMRPAPVAGFNLFSLLMGIVRSYGKEDSTSRTVAGTECFLELCFRFVFGPPHPNAEMVEFHWKLIAKRIAAANGVVCREELLPFLIDTKNPEQELLEAIVRFDGIPECSDSGHLIYRFPSLQNVSNRDDELLEQVNTPGAFLREGQWRFSNSSFRQNVPVVGLIFGNLCFCTVLHFLVLRLPWFGSLQLMLSVITFFWSYSVLIATFPLCRLVINMFRNIAVRQRNKERAALGQQVAHPDADMEYLLTELCALRNLPHNRQVVYDTSQSYIDQAERADTGWLTHQGFAI